jgi:hypothetical protein
MPRKTMCGHPLVPRSKRVMILCTYDTYPFMLVHCARRETDRYVWVSGWYAGHQQLGYWEQSNLSVLAVLTVKNGEKLKKELAKLTAEYRKATAFVRKANTFVRKAYLLERDALLAAFDIRDCD